MSIHQPKPIGTVGLNEISNISTNNPWEKVTVDKIPFSIVGTPNGYLFSNGSACGSLPTTSLEGYTYVADIFLFRKDRVGVDLDRYIGSVNSTQTLSILKIPSSQTPYHHLKCTDLIIDDLPFYKQEQVKSMLGTK